MFTVRVSQLTDLGGLGAFREVLGSLGLTRRYIRCSP